MGNKSNALNCLSSKLFVFFLRVGFVNVEENRHGFREIGNEIIFGGFGSGGNSRNGIFFCNRNSVLQGLEGNF